MIILLEGLDGAGKTTLARELEAEYGLEYLHFGIPDCHPLRHWFKGGLASLNQDAVIDRLHLSEEAYGPVYRSGSQLSRLEFWLLEGWLTARQTLLVMCHPGTIVAFQNQLASNGQYHVTKAGGLAQQEAVALNYGLLRHRTSLPTMDYDYANPGTFRADLNLWVMQRETRLVPGLGSVKPVVWLVGDQPNANVPPDPQLWEFIFKCTNGEYLRRALSLGVPKLDWSTMHLANSRDAAGNTYDLASQWGVLGRPKAVALGNRSAEIFKAQKVPHAKVPHPLWWRRFNYHYPQEYSDVIRQAAGL